MSIYNISGNTARMRISRLIDRDILVADNDLVRGKTHSDAHNCTNAHTHRGVQPVQPVQPVQSVQGVQGVQPVQSVQSVQFVQCLLIITNC